MIAKHSVVVSFSLWRERDNPHPRDFYLDVEPRPINTVWNPQTIIESVWVLYEFDTAEKRRRFIRDLPPAFDRARLYTAPQGFYDHWVDNKLDHQAAWDLTRLERPPVV